MKIVEVIPLYLEHNLFPGPDFEKKGEFQVHFHFFLTDIWLVIVDGPIGVQTLYIFSMMDILLGCKLVRESEIPALGLGVEAKTNPRQCQIRDSQPN